jgi:hypothetical protein
MDKIKLTNWLNRKIAEEEHALSKFDPILCSRCDEGTIEYIKGHISAYKNVKKQINE